MRNKKNQQLIIIKEIEMISNKTKREGNKIKRKI